MYSIRIERERERDDLIIITNIFFSQPFKFRTKVLLVIYPAKKTSDNKLIQPSYF